MSEVKVENIKKVLRKYHDDVSEYHRNEEKSRLGKVLTVIDGSIADETQRKAVKDLIHDAWYGSRNGFVYPQMHHVAEALGFKLWDEAKALDIPIERQHNPYKELVK